jgi:hypothetical protein
MDYLRGFVVAMLMALAGTGGAVIALNFHTASPRLLGVGIACAVLGILGGGLALGRVFGRMQDPMRERVDDLPRPPPLSRFPPIAPP